MLHTTCPATGAAPTVITTSPPSPPQLATATVPATSAATIPATSLAERPLPPKRRGQEVRSATSPATIPAKNGNGNSSGKNRANPDATWAGHDRLAQAATIPAKKSAIPAMRQALSLTQTSYGSLSHRPHLRPYLQQTLRQPTGMLPRHTLTCVGRFCGAQRLQTRFQPPAPSPATNTTSKNRPHLRPLAQSSHHPKASPA